MYFEADKKVWKWYKKNQATRIPANIPDTSTALEYYKRLYTTRKVNTPSLKTIIINILPRDSAFCRLVLV